MVATMVDVCVCAIIIFVSYVHTNVSFIVDIHVIVSIWNEATMNHKDREQTFSFFFFYIFRKINIALFKAKRTKSNAKINNKNRNRSFLKKNKIDCIFCLNYKYFQKYSQQKRIFFLNTVLH